MLGKYWSFSGVIASKSGDYGLEADLRGLFPFLSAQNDGKILIEFFQGYKHGTKGASGKPGGIVMRELSYLQYILNKKKPD